MVVKSAEVDIHSSYGGVVDSASWYLLNAIASLRDKEGRILVDGIYDQIQEPNERELALIEQYANKGPEDVAGNLWSNPSNLEGRPKRIPAPFLF